MKCPSRPADPNSVFHISGNEDRWKSDDTCSYCGSLNPDVLIKRLSDGTVSMVPTDKNYKAYVRNNGGDSFKREYRDCYVKDANGQTVYDTVEGGQRVARVRDPKCTGPDDCTHWITQMTDELKFYYEHFSEEQKKTSVDLCNAHTFKIEYPGYFYVTPFFCAPVATVDS